MSKSALQILDYTLLVKNGGDGSKKIKRKLKSYKKIKNFKLSIEKYSDNTFVSSLINICLRLIKKNSSNPTGIILDSNVIVHDITMLPPVPENFDILCLECDIRNYINLPGKNLYWTQVDANSSGNFVLNNKTATNIIKVLQEFLSEQKKEEPSTTNMWHFLKNKLKVYSITQYQLSESSNTYICNPKTKMIVQEISNKDIDLQIINKWSRMNISNSRLINYDNAKLPKLSLITTFTNKFTFYNTVLSFYKMNYPRDLLELIIVDYKNSEKQMDLSEDNRIKIISLNSNNEKVPIGYLLNVGVKYSTGSVIMHFLDSNVYNPLKVKDIITYMVHLELDCITSKDSGIYNEQKSLRYDFPDLANMIYTRLFWNKCSFEENPSFTTFNVIFNFIKYRTNTITFLPFEDLSFIFNVTNPVYIKTNELDSSIDSLVCTPMQESFNYMKLSTNASK